MANNYRMIMSTLKKLASNFSETIWYTSRFDNPGIFVEGLELNLNVATQLIPEQEFQKAVLLTEGDVVLLPFVSRLNKVTGYILAQHSPAELLYIRRQLWHLCKLSWSGRVDLRNEFNSLIEDLVGDFVIRIPKSDRKPNSVAYHYLLCHIFHLLVSVAQVDKNVQYMGPWIERGVDLSKYRPAALGQDLARTAVLPVMPEHQIQMDMFEAGTTGGAKALLELSNKEGVMSSVVFKNFVNLIGNGKIGHIQHRIAMINRSPITGEAELPMLHVVDTNGIGLKGDETHDKRRRMHETNVFLEALNESWDEMCERGSVTVVSKENSDTYRNFRMVTNPDVSTGIIIRGSSNRIVIPNFHFGSAA